jgi:hypothetical protein
MLSILICSVNNSYLERLNINIRDTIGHEYELLVWDNLADPKPITQVYNLLAARAKYPYCCFIHEDIVFRTNNWSVNLLQAFDQHPETGLIGIAGAKYKSRTPSGWSTGIPGMDFCNIFHQDADGEISHLYSNPHQSRFENTVNVDGVFIAIRKEVWRNIKFNENLLQGFHLYDIDFSFHVHSVAKAAVILNIDILHFTEGGNFGNEWLDYTIQWHHQYAKELPQSADLYPASSRIEKKIARNWIYRLRFEKISFQNKWKWVLAGKSWKDPLAWPYIFLFFLGKKLKKPKA